MAEGDTLIPSTCGPNCSYTTCPRLRILHQDIEMLLANRTKQDEVIWRLRAEISQVPDGGCHVLCDFAITSRHTRRCRPCDSS